MTTERKIEIATKVMHHKSLGLDSFIGFMCIYSIMFSLVGDNEEYIEMCADLSKFSNDSGELAKKDSYHHSKKFPKSRQVRIDFLKKYIEHLKAQEK